MADDTADEQPTGLPAHLRDDLKWKPGQSGNPAGRPKSARSKLSEDFFKALAEDFADNGASAIISMRTERPGDYAKMIAALQSKELTGEDGESLNLGTVIFKGLNGDG
jgi:hypothetical protein